MVAVSVAVAGVLPPAVAAGDDMVSGDRAGVPSLVISDHALLRAKMCSQYFRESVGCRAVRSSSWELSLQQ